MMTIASHLRRQNQHHPPDQPHRERQRERVPHAEPVRHEAAAEHGECHEPGEDRHGEARGLVRETGAAADEQCQQVEDPEVGDPVPEVHQVHEPEGARGAEQDAVVLAQAQR
jgi:hypothetical protein